MLVPGRYQVVAYYTRPGVSPYLKWLKELDSKTRNRIQIRVVRLNEGQFGDCKKIDHHLYELRLFFGPGYRVYFGQHHTTTILLLIGGDKSSQGGDIRKAKEFWKRYLEDIL
jgi:putative addiction module killer protein